MTRIYTIPSELAEAQIPADYSGDLSQLNAVLGAALVQEPNVTGSGRGPLTRWVGYEFGQPRISHGDACALMGVSAQNTVANLAPGDPNPFFLFIDSVDKSGNTLVRSGNYASLKTTNSDDLQWINPDRCVLLTAAGGDVDGLTVIFVVPENSYETNVPDGFPYGKYVDDSSGEPTEVLRKWSEWKSPNHEHRLVDGNYYIPSTSWGVHLKASEWVPFYITGAFSAVMQIPEQTT